MIFLICGKENGSINGCVNALNHPSGEAENG